jgi:hypothetical protein
MQAILILLALALVPVTPAAAATVESFDDFYDDPYFGRDTVIYTAAPGEVNDVSVTFSDGRYVIADPGATIEPGSGCRITDGGHRAECEAQEVIGARIELGDLDDRVSISLPPVLERRPDFLTAIADGGDGADRLQGGDEADILRGGPGDDLLLGGHHGDRLFGGEGSDRLEGGDDLFKTLYAFDPPASGTNPLRGTSDALDGGPGADLLSGGPGIGDSARYEFRTRGVRISPGVLPDDGEAGERDLVMDDVEILASGSGDDVLIGTGAANAFFAGSGDDVVFGGGGFHDVSNAGPGDDTLYLFDGEPEGSGTRGVIPGTHYDDSFNCDDVMFAGGVGPDEYKDVPLEPARGFDTLVIDRGDSSAQTAQLQGCDRVLFGETSVPIDPRLPEVPITAPCPVSTSVLECVGEVDVAVPLPRIAGSAKGPGRFRVPERWRDLGSASFTARRKGKRVRVKLSSKGRRYLRKHPKARAYATFSFRRVRSAKP